MPFWLPKARIVDTPPKYEALRDGSEDVQEEKESFFVSTSSTTPFNLKTSQSHVCISKRVIIIVSSVLAVTVVTLLAVLSTRAIRKPWPVPDFAYSTKVFEPMDDWEYGPRAADLWDSVLENKGFVLIEDWEKYGLKEGITSKVPGAGIYDIAATHQFHCVSMIRDAFMGLATQDPQYIEDFWVSPNYAQSPRFKPAHILHCFDYLRQTIMCYADTTLEWRSYHDPYHIDGYGPPHQCRNWNEVVQWLEAKMPPDERFHIKDD